MIYTNPKNNDTVETDLTPDQAADICEKKGNGFAQDLAAKYARRAYLGSFFSEAQMYWLMKLAHEIANPKEKPFEQLAKGAEQGVIDMFQATDLKRPNLRFKTEAGTVRIYVAGSGKMWVLCGQAIVGQIVDDKFFYTKNCTDVTRKLVRFVTAAPKEAAILWGQKTGCCCFCFRELTTPESVTAGYGPICAERWGLPWGMVGGEKVEVVK